MRALSVFTASLLLLTPLAQSSTRDEPSIEYYQNRYDLADVYEKLVDNRGNGFKPLYGVRNFRAVLNGVVYRGGANNAYNENGSRPNMNPLPDEGLRHLCEEGFESAIYLYATNFDTAPKLTQCKTIFGASGHLDYKKAVPLASTVDEREILKVVHERLTSQTDRSPIYMHCWNGWHASGYISALVLRQFCGYTGAQAVSYWDKNTDGVNQDPGFERIRKKIRAFSPDPEFKIDPSVRAKVCPIKP